MSEQRLHWDGGLRFTGTDAWGRTVALDAEQAGTGAKPSDLLPLSLAACTAYEIVEILRKQRQELDALEALIETTQDDRPPWAFRRIAVRFTARGRVDPIKAQKALALSEHKYCSIAATIGSVVALEFSIAVAER